MGDFRPTAAAKLNNAVATFHKEPRNDHVHCMIREWDERAATRLRPVLIGF